MVTAQGGTQTLCTANSLFLFEEILVTHLVSLLVSQHGWRFKVQGQRKVKSGLPYIFHSMQVVHKVC